VAGKKRSANPWWIKRKHFVTRVLLAARQSLGLSHFVTRQHCAAYHWFHMRRLSQVQAPPQLTVAWPPTARRANGTDVKVQSELLRHSNIQTTLQVYTQAVSDQKRAAREHVVGQLLAG
jgi:integrase